jgi:hypothetical protein
VAASPKPRLSLLEAKSPWPNTNDAAWFVTKAQLMATGVCVGVQVGLGVPGVDVLVGVRVGVRVGDGLALKEGVIVQLGVRVEDGPGDPGVDDGDQVMVTVMVLVVVAVMVDAAASRALTAAPRQAKRRVRRRNILNLKKCSTL